MRINNNIAAFNAYRNLSQTNTTMGKSLEKLSSGFRINRAADDAAGLVRSEGLRSEIGGTKQAIRNAQDGISFVQTAEGALNEAHAILQRMRDLAVSAANGTSNGAAEQAELNELRTELGEIGSRTTFAGSTVFADYANGDAASGGGDDNKVFHIGAGSSDTLSIALDLRLATDGSPGTGGAGTTYGVLGRGFDDGGSYRTLNDIDLSDSTLTHAIEIQVIDEAIDSVSTFRSDLGATQNRLESAVRNLSVAAENLTAAESRIRDTDMAQEMVQFTRNQILQQAGTSMLAQANQAPQAVLSLLR